MEFARSLGRLAGHLAGRGEPALEVTIVNLSGREVQLPRACARVARGELRLAPAVFEVLEALRPGSSGALLFCAGAGSGPSAAAELVVEGCQAEAPHRLRIGYAAAAAGRGHFAVQWAAAANAAGSLACFLEELPAAATLGALASGDVDDGPVRTDSLVAWVSRTSSCGGPLGAVTITLRPRDDPDLLGRPSRALGAGTESAEGAPAPAPAQIGQPHTAGQQPPARPSTAPFLSRRKWLLINVVNYAGVGLTFPPDYARLRAGEAWKEMTYLGPRQSGLLAFGDDLHFAGQAFCSLGNCHERLYFEASNPRVGPNTFSVHFGASGARSSSSSTSGSGSGSGSGDAGGVASSGAAVPGSSWGLQAALEAFAGGFLGVPADATVCGEGFEALVTDARYGDGALATVAVYPRPGTAVASSSMTAESRREPSQGEAC